MTAQNNSSSSSVKRQPIPSHTEFGTIAKYWAWAFFCLLRFFSVDSFQLILQLNFLWRTYLYGNSSNSSSSRHNSTSPALKSNYITDENNFIHKRNFFPFDKRFAFAIVQFISIPSFYENIFSAAAAIIVALGHFVHSVLLISFLRLLSLTGKQSKENEVKWNERKL